MSNQVVFEAINKKIFKLQKFPFFAKNNKVELKDIISNLTKLLTIDSGTLSIDSLNWVKYQDSSTSIEFHITTSLFTGEAFFVFPEADLKQFIKNEVFENIDFDISNNVIKMLAERYIMLAAWHAKNQGLDTGLVIKEGKYSSDTQDLFCIQMSLNAKSSYKFYLYLTKEAYDSWNDNNSYKRIVDIRDSDSSIQDIIIPIKAIAGESSIKLGDLNNLAAGDALILNWGSDISDNSYINLEIDSRPIFRAQINGESIKIKEYAMSLDEDISASKPEDVKEEGQKEEGQKEEQNVSKDESKDNKSLDKGKSSYESFISNLDIVVKAEVGEIQHKAIDIAQLQPGNTLDFSSDGTIFLTVNGIRIATGRMVKIGDSFGIQVVNSLIKTGK